MVQFHGEWLQIDLQFYFDREIIMNATVSIKKCLEFIFYIYSIIYIYIYIFVDGFIKGVFNKKTKWSSLMIIAGSLSFCGLCNKYRILIEIVFNCWGVTELKKINWFHTTVVHIQTLNRSGWKKLTISNTNLIDFRIVTTFYI